MIDLFYLCRWTTHLHVSSHVIRCPHGAEPAGRNLTYLSPEGLFRPPETHVNPSFLLYSHWFQQQLLHCRMAFQNVSVAHCRCRVGYEYVGSFALQVLRVPHTAHRLVQFLTAIAACYNHAPHPSPQRLEHFGAQCTQVFHHLRRADAFPRVRIGIVVYAQPYCRSRPKEFAHREMG